MIFLKKSIKYTSLLIITLCLILGLMACNPSTPTVSSSITTSTSPLTSPITTTAVSTQAVSSPTSASSQALTSSAATMSPGTSTTLSPTPTTIIEKKPAEVTVVSNKTTVSFPDSINFSLEADSALPVKSVVLEFSTSKRSIVEEITRIQAQFSPGSKIVTNYSLEMKKTGSFPPKTEIWYQWRINDNDDRTFLTPRQTLIYEDTRYKWNTKSLPDMDIYWHDQDSTMIDSLLKEVQSRLSHIKLEITIPAERKIKVLVYKSSEEIKSAILFSQGWTGAAAFPSYNIILTAVNPSILDWAKGALPHEITHLMVGEAVFGAFGDIPTWLGEGLAEYSAGDITQNDKDILKKALSDGKLISIRSLASGFSTDSAQANLSYIESHSFVSYLIENYGWDKIKMLLAVFKDGSTYDKALTKVYGSDTATLDKEWKTRLGK
jgi:hypothetical protein